MIRAGPLIRADPTYTIVAVCDGNKTQIFSFSKDGKQEYRSDLSSPSGDNQPFVPKDFGFLPVSKAAAKYLADGDEVSGRFLLAASSDGDLYLYEEVAPFNFQCRDKLSNIDGKFESSLAISSFPPGLAFGMITTEGLCCVYSLSVEKLQVLPIRRYVVDTTLMKKDEKSTTRIKWMDFLDRDTVLCASTSKVYECKLTSETGEEVIDLGAEWTQLCLSRHGTGQLAVLTKDDGRSFSLTVYHRLDPAPADPAKRYGKAQLKEKLKAVRDMTWSPFGFCLAVQMRDNSDTVKYFSEEAEGDGFVLNEQRR